MTKAPRGPTFFKAAPCAYLLAGAFDHVAYFENYPFLVDTMEYTEAAARRHYDAQGGASAGVVGYRPRLALTYRVGERPPTPHLPSRPPPPRPARSRPCICLCARTHMRTHAAPDPPPPLLLPCPPNPPHVPCTPPTLTHPHPLTRPPLRTGGGLTNQLYAHLHAFMLAREMRAELVLAPALRRNSLAADMKDTAWWVGGWVGWRGAGWLGGCVTSSRTLARLSCARTHSYAPCLPCRHVEPISTLLDVPKMQAYWAARGVTLHQVPYLLLLPLLIPFFPAHSFLPCSFFSSLPACLPAPACWAALWATLHSFAPRPC